MTVPVFDISFGKLSKKSIFESKTLEDERSGWKCKSCSFLPTLLPLLLPLLRASADTRPSLSRGVFRWGAFYHHQLFWLQDWVPAPLPLLVISWSFRWHSIPPELYLSLTLSTFDTPTSLLSFLYLFLLLVVWYFLHPFSEFSLSSLCFCAFFFRWWRCVCEDGCDTTSSAAVQGWKSLLLSCTVFQTCMIPSSRHGWTHTQVGMSRLTSIFRLHCLYKHMNMLASCVVYLWRIIPLTASAFYKLNTPSMCFPFFLGICESFRMKNNPSPSVYHFRHLLTFLQCQTGFSSISSAPSFPHLLIFFQLIDYWWKVRNKFLSGSWRERLSYTNKTIIFVTREQKQEETQPKTF